VAGANGSDRYEPGIVGIRGHETTIASESPPDLGLFAWSNQYTFRVGGTTGEYRISGTAHKS
jgi:hypothetical protein